MERRACVAASNLPEYVGDGATCTNPTFNYTIETPAGVAVDACHTLPRSATPCNVVVTLTHRFDLVAPTGLLGLPSSFSFERTSVFAMSDFELDPEEAPAP
jgi:hypothetical protein